MCAQVAFAGRSAGGVRLSRLRADGNGKSAELHQVADSTTGKRVHTFSGHADTIRALAFSPTGKHLASGAADRTIKIWDLATGRNIKP